MKNLKKSISNTINTLKTQFINQSIGSEELAEAIIDNEKKRMGKHLNQRKEDTKTIPEQFNL